MGALVGGQGSIPVVESMNTAASVGDGLRRRGIVVIVAWRRISEECAGRHQRVATSILLLIIVLLPWTCQRVYPKYAVEVGGKQTQKPFIS